ncbi:MAG: hypothetical protein HQL66_03355 [Magnetococcales bacterium]|nr:hypothetical protein [Magnetococcales bacterium]
MITRKIFRAAHQITRETVARFPGASYAVTFAAALRGVYSENRMPILVEKINRIHGVQSAKLWEKHGFSRIYVDLEKFNGGRNWNGGRGHTAIIESGQVCLGRGEWAGAATYKWHENNDTLAKIQAVIG